MALLQEVFTDGYQGVIAGSIYTLGTTTVPHLTAYGEQRVQIDVGGVSASLTNPLPVTLATSTDSLQTSFSTQPDYSVSTIVQLTALAAKSQGILVTAHPSNTQVVRISGSDVSTTEGQPLGAGASFTFAVTNASILWAVAESGTQKICVSAV